MPFPLLLLIPVAAKVGVILKTGAVAAKGAAVIGKVVTSKAVLAKGVAAATHAYGATTVIAFGAVATLSVGAAALICERAERLKRAIERKDVKGSVLAATGLLNEIGGHGGLDGASRILHDFISVGGDSVPAVEKTSSMLDDLIRVLKQRLA